jgi:hypothetical protein
VLCRNHLKHATQVRYCPPSPRPSPPGEGVPSLVCSEVEAAILSVRERTKRFLQSRFLVQSWRKNYFYDQAAHGAGREVLLLASGATRETWSAPFTKDWKIKGGKSGCKNGRVAVTNEA